MHYPFLQTFSLKSVQFYESKNEMELERQTTRHPISNPGNQVQVSPVGRRDCTQSTQYPAGRENTNINTKRGQTHAGNENNGLEIGNMISC